MEAQRADAQRPAQEGRWCWRRATGQAIADSSHSTPGVKPRGSKEPTSNQQNIVASCDRPQVRLQSVLTHGRRATISDEASLCLSLLHEHPHCFRSALPVQVVHLVRPHPSKHSLSHISLIVLLLCPSLVWFPPAALRPSDAPVTDQPYTPCPSYARIPRSWISPLCILPPLLCQSQHQGPAIGYRIGLDIVACSSAALAAAASAYNRRCTLHAWRDHPCTATSF